jgi:predicted O-methyltransferase YrrM
MKNNIYQEYINQLIKDFNTINDEINRIKNKSKKEIMSYYLKKLLRKIDDNQLQINPYYRKIFYYQRWKERIQIDSSKELQILEIGVYKGEMSIWFINHLLEHKNSRINLVDTWKGSVEYNEDFNKVYEEYKENIKYSKYPKKVIENRMTSLEFLAKHILKYPKPYFDIIFIDACHDSRCVMTDAMLSWKVLKLNGFLVFDDYGWNLLRDKPDYVRPKMSIDCFLNLFRDDIKIIHKGYKVFLRKIKEYKF